MAENSWKAVHSTHIKYMRNVYDMSTDTTRRKHCSIEPTLAPALASQSVQARRRRLPT